MAAALEMRPLSAQLLRNRGITELDQAKNTLDPSLRGLPDPLTLHGFSEALDCLLRAQEHGRKVFIHGDYDVDGTCGAVLLAKLMERLGLEYEVFLPDRILDGYSFGERSLERIEAFGAEVVMAVDNGTTAFDALREMERRGLEVIVVDHHLPAAELPPCTALINPWVVPEGSEALPFQHYCGGAMAWLLTWGVLRHVLGDGALGERDRRFLFDGLGFAALATICDVMPLLGPNRAIVQQGLASLPESTFPGLRSLVRSARIVGVPSATDVAFRIGPRLNAAGRMMRSELSYRVLSTSDPQEAKTLCEQLESLNSERRERTELELKNMLGAAEEQHQRGDGVVFSGHAEAHFGVLGIVANQVMERTGLPTLLWSECTPGLARGSARAPEGQHLLRILEPAAHLLEGYGGHARAAGFHFKPEHADAVAEALRQGAAQLPPAEPPSLDIDAEVGTAEIDRRTVEEFERLEPFGEAFPKPLFLCTGAEVATEPRRIGDGSHVELRLEKDGQVVRALGWRMAERLQHLGCGDHVDVVVEVGLNRFRGQCSVEWTLRDLHSSDGS